MQFALYLVHFALKTGDFARETVHFPVKDE